MYRLLTCGENLILDFEKAGVQWILGETKLVEDAVTKLGPFLDEHFGRVSPSNSGSVEIVQEVGRDLDEVSPLATAQGLLGERTSPVDRVLRADEDVSILEKRNLKNRE